ncbi:MAG: hypothetical protein ABSA52_19410, partial [Candidatus Binatia bacterium]
PSYRTRHLPPLDLPDSNSDHATKSDRISGKKRTQFPEPTAGFSAWLSLTQVVPLVNIVVLFYVALAEWPVHRELRSLSQPFRNPAV